MTVTLSLPNRHAKVLKGAVGFYAMKNNTIPAVVTTAKGIINRIPNKQGRFQQL